MFETRSRLGVEVRGDDKPRIEGYAVRYFDGTEGTEYRPFGDDSLIERVMPDAFDEVRDKDVIGAFNHDLSRILGRTSSDTMQLEFRDDGVFYSIDPPASEAPLLESIRRGDISGSSFGFRVADGGSSAERQGDSVIRSIERVSVLRDVGPTPLPAYDATSAEVRALIENSGYDYLKLVENSYNACMLLTQRARLQQLR